MPVLAMLRRDPFYYRNRRQRMLEQQQERQGGMNFLEAIFRWVGFVDVCLLKGWPLRHMGWSSGLLFLQVEPYCSMAAWMCTDPSSHYHALPCSFVFGDGDPNEDFDRKRWQAVCAAVSAGCLNMEPGHVHGQPPSCLHVVPPKPLPADDAAYHRPMPLQIGRYIQSRGGTVVAEELAPFLDLQPSQLAADRGSRVTGARRADSSSPPVHNLQLRLSAGGCLSVQQ